jgi:hypothetical protein
MFTNFINWFKRVFLGYKVEEQHMNLGSGPRDKTKKTHNGPQNKHYGHGQTNNDKVR